MRNDLGTQNGYIESSYAHLDSYSSSMRLDKTYIVSIHHTRVKIPQSHLINHCQNSTQSKLPICTTIQIKYIHTLVLNIKSMCRSVGSCNVHNVSSIHAVCA